MKTLLPILLFVLLTLKSTAQDNLHMLFSHAPLPAWVNQDPEKYHSLILAQWKAAGIKMNKDGEKQLYESTLAQYDYLSSGRLLFNDEAGVLLNRLADSLLRTQPEIRKQLKIYAYYSAGTNALCFSNGLIIIELGLIAQMENEDQLAFVLSHEISHFIDGHYSTQEIAIRPDHTTDEINAYLKFRRDEENATDLDAFDLYKKAKFSVTQALRAFDIMERNWMVPTEFSFDVSFFENSSFHYPFEFYRRVTDVTPGYSDYDFNNATHESFQIRKAKVAEFYKLDTNAVSYQKASADFDRVNKLVVYNCGLIALEEEHFAAAIYAGYYLHYTDSTEREMSDLLLDKAIYQYAASKTTLKKSDDAPLTTQIKHQEKMGNIFSWSKQSDDPNDLRGYICQVDSFLESMTTYEAMVLSMDWSWKYCTETSKHRDIARFVCANSIEVYTLTNATWPDSLASLPVPSSFFDEEDYSSGVFSDLSHQDSIKLNTALDKLNSTDPLRKSISKELFKQRNNAANLYEQQHPKKTITHPKYISTQLKNISKDSAFINFYIAHFVTKSDISNKQELNQFERLSADSMYLIGSQHIWLREYKRTDNFYVKGEKTIKKSKAHYKQFQSISRGNKIKLLSNDPLAPDTLSIDLYNDYCLARRVFSEIITSDDKYFVVPLAYKSEFDSICGLNSVTHAIVDISITKQYSKVREPAIFVVGLIFPYTTLFALIWIIPPRQFTYRQTVIYDLQTGRADHSWIQTDRGHSAANPSLNYYTTILRSIKKPKKQKK